MGGGGGTEAETDTTDDRDSLIRHDQINRPEVHLVWNLELLVGFYRVESAAVCVYSAFGQSGGGGAGGGKGRMKYFGGSGDWQKRAAVDR